MMDARCFHCQGKFGELQSMLYTCEPCADRFRGKVKELEAFIAYQNLKIENQRREILNKTASKKVVNQELKAERDKYRAVLEKVENDIRTNYDDMDKHWFYKAVVEALK